MNKEKITKRNILKTGYSKKKERLLIEIVKTSRPDDRYFRESKEVFSEIKSGNFLLKRLISLYPTVPNKVVKFLKWSEKNECTKTSV